MVEAKAANSSVSDILGGTEADVGHHRSAVEAIAHPARLGNEPGHKYSHHNSSLFADVVYLLRSDMDRVCVALEQQLWAVGFASPERSSYGRDYTRTYSTSDKNRS
jgi:hypothetical protein